MKLKVWLAIALGLATAPSVRADDHEIDTTLANQDSATVLELAQDPGDRRGRDNGRYNNRGRPRETWQRSRGSSHRYRPDHARWRWNHARHQRPHGGWTWNRAYYPNWYRQRPATVFPAWRWFQVPRGYYQCFAFRSNLYGYVGTGRSLDEAAYSALYECGGSNYRRYGCYIPSNYCRLRY